MEIRARDTGSGLFDYDESFSIPEDGVKQQEDLVESDSSLFFSPSTHDSISSPEEDDEASTPISAVQPVFPSSGPLNGTSDEGTVAVEDSQGPTVASSSDELSAKRLEKKRAVTTTKTKEFQSSPERTFVRSTKRRFEEDGVPDLKRRLLGEWQVTMANPVHLKTNKTRKLLKDAQEPEVVVIAATATSDRASDIARSGTDPSTPAEEGSVDAGGSANGFARLSNLKCVCRTSIPKHSPCRELVSSLLQEDPSETLFRVMQLLSLNPTAEFPCFTHVRSLYMEYRRWRTASSFRTTGEFQSSLMAFVQSKQLTGKAGAFRNAPSSSEIRRRARPEPSKTAEKPKLIVKSESAHLASLPSSAQSEATITPSAGLLINPGHASDQSDVLLEARFRDILKPHQIEGIRFLWRNIVTRKGHGAILAHSMGLGKTLQAVLFTYLYLREAIGNRVLILAPTTVLLNWDNEYHHWVPPELFVHLKVLLRFERGSHMEDRVEQLERWMQDGGVLLLSYNFFRQMNGESARTPDQAEIISRALLSPGPSLIVCDEGHIIRNEKSVIARLLKQVDTKSRVCLSGYPLQNNLEEYWSMVDFVCPGVLSELPLFRSQFISPIEQGLSSDCPPVSARLARKRLYVLVGLLDDYVLRKDASLLERDMPPKHEFVIECRLSPLQEDLYRTFLSVCHEYKGSVNHHVLLGGLVAGLITNHPSVLRSTILQYERNRTCSGTLPGKKEWLKGWLSMEDRQSQGNGDYFIPLRMFLFLT